MKASFFKIVLVIVIIPFLSSRPLRRDESYVDKYRTMAIAEMKRTGIPASIKLAQGLMESQMGRSELAINANNHFGIKCKSDWNGETYEYKDDDTNESGEIIHSCFRKYSSAEFSYIDHSNFLVSRSRYKMLFEFDKSDYRAWARGLKACGYATDPGYADKLIESIERLELFNLDKIENEEKPELDFYPYAKLEKLPEQPSKIIIALKETTIKSPEIIMVKKELVKSKSSFRKKRTNVTALKTVNN